MAATRAPGWYWGVSIILLLWALAGCAAFAAHLAIDQKALAAMTDYDRRYFLALPSWFVAAFALATVPAIAGGIALVARSRFALPLYVLSLIGVVIQFGYVLGATDLIAVKGFATAAGFPIFIFAMALVQIWFARHAATKGWLR